LDRPPIYAPPSRRAGGRRESEREGAARQPALGLAGLLLVVPVAVVLGVGAGGLEPSLRVLGPLSTFGLPIVAMIAFWWEDWPGAQLQAPLSGLLDTVLVILGAVLLTLLGQLVVGHFDLHGVFDPTPGPGTSPTFPATMPLAGAFFVVILQVTLVSEGWPLRRLGRTASGPAALLVAWAIALTLYLLLVRTPPKPGSGLYFRSGGPLSGAEFGAVLTAIGLWQTWFYVAIRGWPFSEIAPRAARLPLANATVIGAGVSTYIILHTALGLSPQTVSAVAGSALAAVLLHGMLFDGRPRLPEHPARERLITLAVVAVLSAALYAGLTALAHRARWITATPTEWVTYAGLNAIGLGVILHVAIGRRWPFAATGPDRRPDSRVDV
ncbi:MAG TPA: hypothetical protein VGH93_01245, partial [Solirubrobacteraceae bacterium]